MMKNQANEADQESDLKEAFKIFDRDKNGYIDMKELKQVLTPLHGCSWCHHTRVLSAPKLSTAGRHHAGRNSVKR